MIQHGSKGKCLLVGVFWTALLGLLVGTNAVLWLTGSLGTAPPSASEPHCRAQQVMPAELRPGKAFSCMQAFFMRLLRPAGVDLQPRIWVSVAPDPTARAVTFTRHAPLTLTGHGSQQCPKYHIYGCAAASEHPSETPAWMSALHCPLPAH